MWQRVTCNECGAVLEYDTSSVWESNRESEDVKCPICKHVVGSVFTDLIPQEGFIRKGNEIEG